jgi:hypothetical protein
MLDRLDCTAEPSSVRAARRFVIDKLQEWDCDDLVDSAALVTSELATNAVLHTGQPYSVAIEQRDGGVRVEVADRVLAMPPHPAVVPPIGSDAGDAGDGEPVDLSHLFSGLGLVDAVATRWGSQPNPEGGKVVWFELARRTFSRSRDRVVDLRDLRDPEPPTWLPVIGDGKERVGGREPEEKGTMARYLVDDDERVIEEHYVEERRGGGPIRWLIGLLLIAALAMGAFWLLGGDADIDTKGGFDVPEVDVDVNPPNVDVDTEQAPPATAEAG